MYVNSSVDSANDFVTEPSTAGKSIGRMSTFELSVEPFGAMYEISTLLLLLLKMYLIMSKHRKSLILLKKLVVISNFNVFLFSY